jgi:hypothetical protein
LAKFNDDNKYGALQNKLDKSLIDAIIANAIAYRPFLLEVVNKIEPEHFSERDDHEPAHGVPSTLRAM